MVSPHVRLGILNAKKPKADNAAGSILLESARANARPHFASVFIPIEMLSTEHKYGGMYVLTITRSFSQLLPLGVFRGKCIRNI